MGLYIYAYTRLTPVDLPEGWSVTSYGDVHDADDDYIDDHHTFDTEMTEAEWPGRTEGIVHGQVYYAPQDSGMWFQVGAYSAYGDWRNKLANVIGYEVADDVWENYGEEEGKDLPFYELINFSDCDGLIGPVVSAKLADDFETFDELAFACSESGAWEDWYELYKKWKTAFKVAADRGAVVFC